MNRLVNSWSMILQLKRLQDCRIEKITGLQDYRITGLKRL
jgi:hypothetical protein